MKKNLCAALAAALALGAAAAYAERGEGSATARQGVVRCGGSNFLRLAGTEIQYTVPDMLDRPWADIWEKHLEKGMERPVEELDLGFK